MANLSIKDVPEDWAARLRARAARNHRSLQGELMAILERALNDEPGARPDWAGAHHGLGGGGDRRVIRQGWKTVEQVAAELRALHPEPIRQQAPSIELIREDRDNR